MRIKSIIIFLIFIIATVGYKQFTLSRVRLDNSQSKGACSIQELPVDKSFQQLCYLKDVSYRMELFIDGTIYYVAMDLTVPYPWLKSPDCKDNSNCHIIRNSQKQQALSQFKDVKIKHHMFNRHKVSIHQKDVAIYGSSDLIIGEVQTMEFAQVYAKDSKHVKQFTKLVGISLFLTPEKDEIRFQNVSFIRGQKISHEVNEMIDGAISLKPDNDPSNNFLEQIFMNTGKNKRIVTIFIHPMSRKGVVSIGDVSLKYSKVKHSEIVWLEVSEDTTFGLSIACQSIALGDQIIPHPISAISSQFTLKFTKNIFFTISTSYIFLPKDIIQWLISDLTETTNSICQFPTKGHSLKCRWQRLEDKKKALFKTLSFKLNQKQQLNIQMLNLIEISQDLYFQFTIRQSQSDVIILGEPFFQQNVVYIDYFEGKMGIVPSYFHQSDKFARILIYFMRFILFGAILSLLAYICFRPFNKVMRFVRGKYDKFVHRNSGESSFSVIPQSDAFS